MKPGLTAIPLAGVLFSAIALGGTFSSLSAQGGGDARAVYLGSFQPYKSPANPALEKRIRASVLKALTRRGLRAQPAEGIGPAAGAGSQAAPGVPAVARSSFLYVTGYYREGKSGRLSLYAQIYHPGTGYVIDALIVADELGELKGVTLDPGEIKNARDDVLDEFSRKLTGRVLSNPRRRERRANVEEFLLYSPLGRDKRFPIRRADAKKASAQVFQFFQEQTISIVSRRVGKGEGTSRAAAIVSVVERGEIADSGARNLADILQAVPGVAISYDQFGFYKVALRGIRSRSGVLLLLDGHRINNFYDGSTFLDLRADIIERIEIIRGPGSSIHGTNAFTGVINVITRAIPRGRNTYGLVSTRLGGLYTTYDSQVFRGIRINPTSEDVSGRKTGERRFHERRLSNIEPFVMYGRRFGAWDFSVLSHVYKDERQRFRIEYDGTCSSRAWGEFNNVVQRRSCEDTVLPLPLSDHVLSNDDKEQQNVFLSASHGENFYVHVKLLRETRGPNLGEFIELTPESDLESQLVLFNLGLRKGRVTRNLAYSMRLYHDTFLKNDDIEVSRADRIRHLGLSTRKKISYNYNTLGYELITDWTLGRNNSLVAGVQLERLQVENFNIRQNFQGKDVDTLFPVFADYDRLATPQNTSRTIIGIFAQDLWRVAPTLDLTLGVRYDRYSDFGRNLSPKSGLVWTPRIKPNFGLVVFKVLYGEAFRAPTFQELYDQTQKFQSNGVFGNTELQPERIRTYELGVEYQTPWKPLSMGWNAYSNLIRNNIEGTNTSSTFPGSEDQYRNLRGINVRGFEAQVKLKLNPRNYGFLNVSWFRSTDLGGFSEFPDREVRTDRLDVPQWRANLGVQMSAGPYIDLNNGVWITSERFANFRFVFETTPGRRFKLPRYAVWNLSLATTPKLWKGFKFRLSVFNVLDTPVFDDANLPEEAFFNRSFPTQGRYIEFKGTWIFDHGTKSVPTGGKP